MATTKWTVDAMHSQIQFKVKHLMITTVTGNFNDYSATVIADDDNFTNSKIEFIAKTNSINTGQAQRDGHLMSDDFFNAEKFPEIKFSSTSFYQKGSDWVLEGNLTIRDNSLPVKLDVEFGGIMKDPYGNTKAGFEISGKISRKAFGLNWNAVTEAGGIMVSDEVKIVASVQLIKEA